MKNNKSVKASFAAKFFSGIVFVLSAFITIFSFVCIIFLTSFGAFDSSKEAAINSMRDSLYNQVIQNYCNDALELCVFDEKDVFPTPDKIDFSGKKVPASVFSSYSCGSNAEWSVLPVKGNIEERAIHLAQYIVENRTTVRSAAAKFGISKSTVHMVIY